MKSNFLTAFIALVAQISGIVTIVAGIGVVVGAQEAIKLCLYSAPIFLVACILIHRRKGGWAWLFAWSIPFPF